MPAEPPAFPVPRHWPWVPRLAYADLRHDWRVSGALMLSIVSVLAPLLLLFGIKTGVVDTLREILLKDPRNLEVIVFENTRLPRVWFENLRADTRLVRFVIPRTRTLNTLIDVQNRDDHLLKHVEIVPTAAGDPLLPRDIAPPARPLEVLLTHAAATPLAVERGETVKVWLKRTLAGEDQREAVELTVTGIVPESAFARPALFADLAFLEAVEDYKDGYAVPILAAGAAVASWEPLLVRAGGNRNSLECERETEPRLTGLDSLALAGLDLAPDPRPTAAPARGGVLAGKPRAEPRSTYASARLYARRPEEVAALADRLRVSGLEVRTRGEDLARLQAVDRLLERVFALIAAIALVGGYLAFGGAIWITIERKRATLALLRLIGLGGTDIVAFCLCQAAFLGGTAFACSYLLYGLGEWGLNHFGSGPLVELLGVNGVAGRLCHLRPANALAAGAATLAFTLFTASLGAIHAKSFQPAECLRDT
jgi:putative ABC transport system permease protein